MSRNVFFYKKMNLSDSFETRIYLMFLHFSLLMIIYKKKNSKFSQDSYDSLFHNIENNLRELGFGDVSVNKKMKELNKILYDILLKIDKSDDEALIINKELILKYFKDLKQNNDQKYADFERYLVNFYNFCFEIPLDNVLRGAIKFTF